MTSARRHAHVVNIEEVAADEEEQPTVGYYDDQPLAKP
jgi:hypothetical protein